MCNPYTCTSSQSRSNSRDVGREVGIKNIKYESPMVGDTLIVDAVKLYLEHLPHWGGFGLKCAKLWYASVCINQ